MNEPCTGCGKQTDNISCVTVTRRGALSVLQQQLGHRRRKSTTTFVADGLCDDCAGRVIESVRLMWTSQSLKAQGRS